MAIDVQPNAAGPQAPINVTPNVQDPGMAPADAAGQAPEANPPVEIPKEVASIPAVQAILAGSPPAASADIRAFEKRPEGKAIFEAKGPLMAAGMGFYRSLKGNTGVMFNQFFINGEALKQADQAGKLQELAPPFDALNSEVKNSGKNHPLLNMSQDRPQGLAAAPQFTPPQSQAMPGGPNTAQSKKLTTARLKAMQPGPLQGPKPGQGRLLNRIMQPVV